MLTLLFALSLAHAQAPADAPADAPAAEAAAPAGVQVGLTVTHPGGTVSVWEGPVGLPPSEHPITLGKRQYVVTVGSIWDEGHVELTSFVYEDNGKGKRKPLATLKKDLMGADQQYTLHMMTTRPSGYDSPDPMVQWTLGVTWSLPTAEPPPPAPAPEPEPAPAPEPAPDPAAESPAG